MTVEQRDIVEVLREGATAYADEVGGGHAYRYTRAADEIERLRKWLEYISRYGDEGGSFAREAIAGEPLPETYK